MSVAARACAGRMAMASRTMADNLSFIVAVLPVAVLPGPHSRKPGGSDQSVELLAKFLTSQPTDMVTAASGTQPKGRPGGPGLKTRDPTWTAQQIFDHSRRDAQSLGYLEFILRQSRKDRCFTLAADFG